MEITRVPEESSNNGQKPTILELSNTLSGLQEFTEISKYININEFIEKFKEIFGLKGEEISRQTELSKILSTEKFNSIKEFIKNRSGAILLSDKDLDNGSIGNISTIEDVYIFLESGWIMKTLSKEKKKKILNEILESLEKRGIALNIKSEKIDDNLNTLTSIISFQEILNELKSYELSNLNYGSNEKPNLPILKCRSNFCKSLKYCLIYLGWIKNEVLYMKDDKEKNITATNIKDLLGENFILLIKILTEVGSINIDDNWIRNTKKITFFDLFDKFILGPIKDDKEHENIEKAIG